MKNIKFALAAVVMLAMTCGMFAQNGFDYFGIPRQIQLAKPNYIAAATTNGSIDIHGFIGVGVINFMSCTNGDGTGALTATLQTSTDNTNWTAISSYALGRSATVSYTNMNWGGTNLYVTDTYILPGTITTPTAATAGWATSYLLPSQFTNTGAITLTTPGVYSVGVNLTDSPRYLRVYFTPDESMSNSFCGAVLTGRRGSEVKQ